jgi:hypothetical protein
MDETIDKQNNCLVGVTRIELATSRTPSERSTDDLHPVVQQRFTEVILTS